MEDYNETYQMFKDGDISLEEWNEYCFQILERLIVENERLHNIINCIEG